ncbi:TrbC/VirB2 family protein [Sphingomonas sp. OTU376]|uniref:TrbC/VirB2 family protein n=1 Tax=Sphingomonas sp. OTU376 TaxID=3043863 RepID=UPI00313E6493
MITPSLADPGGSGPLVAAVQWIEGVALGTIATSIALIAVASVGFLMLNGRLPIRRGVTVIAGCFILFGAQTIAAGILGVVQPDAPTASYRAQATPSLPRSIPTPKTAPPYDPYAGAAVPQR